MARERDRLNDVQVRNAKRDGFYCDGGGLYLQVRGNSKSWLFRYSNKWIGLGPYPDVPLKGRPDPIRKGELIIGARDKAADCRRLLAQGIDPLQARRAARARSALDDARSISFAECAAAYIKAHRATWKNEKHADQWTNTLTTYCGPVFGAQPVQAVDTALVVKVLEPIWTAKHETSTRLRSRIEKVLDWATVRGYRAGDNPARWRGHLDKLLPAIEKRKRVQHHPALPFVDMGAFITELRTQDGTAARALEFTILTSARTNEVIGARWEEIDLEAALWTIPAARMKSHREHRVPLSPRAAALLRARLDGRDEDFIFAGLREGKPLSNMAMLELLKRMGRTDLTVHGFRSTFRDWASERTSYPREVCEMALAHAISDQTEAAYRRGDLFEKRRRLMNEWAKFCATPKQRGAKVTSINRAA